MSVITVDTLSRCPIYEQLIDNVKKSVLCGTLAPGEQMPSVRALAVELAVNPNTIQKAYAELERLGIICSMPGRGSFIADNVRALAETNRGEITERLRKDVRDALDAGINGDEIITVVKEVTDSGERSPQCRK